MGERGRGSAAGCVVGLCSLRSGGAMALRAEGGGIAMGPLCDPGSEDAPRGRKGARLRRGLCRRVVFASRRGRRPFGTRVVVAADAADYKRGAQLRRGLCRRVVFASLRGRRPFGPRVVVAPFGRRL